MTAANQQAEVGRDLLRQVSRHRMTVLRDAGFDRHLRFRRPKTGINGFDLVTWAGRLTITGDCGTYAFARLPDMFAFFRGEVGRINPGYWAQKLLAVDRDRGVREFDENTARGSLAAAIADWPKDVQREAWSEIGAHDSEIDFRTAVDNLEIERDGAIYRVADFWECATETWTYGFLWNLHAIVWGISIYDAAKDRLIAGAEARELRK